MSMRSSQQAVERLELTSHNLADYRQIAWARTVIPGQAVHVERESRKTGHLPHPGPQLALG
ncbi:hypothetical protein NC652_012534 [Populus alba x Populus x berolinensis]|nr:hypothetical protein NC652_012534 [Populus alba x Populus x berolinensis]